MPQYLRENSQLTQHGITLTGDGLGNEGVFSIVGFNRFNRLEKYAQVLGYWYKDKAEYEGERRVFCEFSFDIIGEDFDNYLVPAPTENEADMYLLIIKRCYDYVSDKAELYRNNMPVEGEVHPYAQFEEFCDIVDDPNFA